MKAHHDHIILCGLLLAGFGLLVRYHIGRRRFNRRGMAGLQQFTSYKRALIVSSIETLINILGAACIVAGAALVLITYF